MRNRLLAPCNDDQRAQANATTKLMMAPTQTKIASLTKCWLIVSIHNHSVYPCRFRLKKSGCIVGDAPACFELDDQPVLG